MPPKPPLKSCSQVLIVLALLCWQQRQISAQTISPPSTTKAATNASAANDPTRPEPQPRLDVDRDPVTSPDPEESVPEPTASTGSSQGASAIQKDKSGLYTLHANVDEVLLNCSVIDEKGRTVSDLTAKDFRVWEDGVPQTVNSVLHQDLPVSMGILADNSGSMRDKRAAVNVAALDLLRQSNPRDTAFIVNFSDRAFLDQGFTSDLVALKRGLARYDSQGTTAMYDAVAASADELVRYAKDRKQALLIITDGADNASRLTLSQTIRRVQNLGGPVVYTIGLLFDVDRQEADEARDALESLSRETGGIAYFPRSLEELDGIMAEVAHDIRDQYVIDYRSTKPASLGGYRAVHVEVRSATHGKFTVRTKKGYYAEPIKSESAQALKQ
jgi:Ca-activated chloride channel homolog